MKARRIFKNRDKIKDHILRVWVKEKIQRWTDEFFKNKAVIDSAFRAKWGDFND